HGLSHFGARAQNWLRQEKSYRAFGSDIGRDATPLESGLDRFVDLTKDFTGKWAMQQAGIRSRCVTLTMDGPEDADPWGREALHQDGRVVGRLTSGGWSVAAGRRIGLGYVSPELAEAGTPLQVRIMGDLWPAQVVPDSPYDPENARLRADG
ncbi:MAG: glycine cleavage T C-terminal barrel domain-containing protein, partial [Pseudomonadota bacterium]